MFKTQWQFDNSYTLVTICLQTRDNCVGFYTLFLFNRRYSMGQSVKILYVFFARFRRDGVSFASHCAVQVTITMLNPLWYQTNSMKMSLMEVH